MQLIKITSVILVSLSLFLTACEEEEESTTPQATGSITVESQLISQNKIMVNSAEISTTSGWLVVHKDNNGSPQVPGIISVPNHIEEGTSQNLRLQIDSTASISDGEKVWVMLHEDTGEKGTYEFDGQNGLDPAVTSGDSPVTTQITINSPKVQANNQPITNDMATIAQVESAVQGWVVIHKDDGTGAPGAVIGHAAVSEGSTSDLKVSLDESISYESGMTLFPMLHVDKGTEGDYEFPGADLPEIFGNSSPDIVLTSFMVEAGSSPDTVLVDMIDNTFDPKEKTIESGTTVKWVNKDDYIHDVTSEDDTFASGNIEAEGSFSYTFNSTGTYPYICTIHDGMEGTIIVE
ncbi:MAG: cupredoxin domain-containing protein [Bacteroidales bacterium]|nr:cupredoxin domain-containing protein [Bacteroidales bacterium]MCF8332618.1 cupredoxin domain-containing protein [Bacteroidales bacterium]